MISRPNLTALSVALTLAASALTGVAGAQAAQITVATTADVSASQCTLRDAITAANTNAIAGACAAGSGPDTITFSTTPGTITLGSVLPALNSQIDIQAAGVTIDGANTYQGLNNASNASISGLRVTNGRCTFGCGIFNTGTLSLTGVTVDHNVAAVTGGTNAFPQGGGIANQGNMTLTLSTVSLNQAAASGASSQNSPAAGGIFNQGNLTIDRSAVTGNSATAVAPGGAATTNINGGAIDEFSGQLTIRRSLIAGNTVSATGSLTGNSATGGGIAAANSPMVNVTIDRSTIAGNVVSAPGPVGNGASGGFNVAGTNTTYNVTSSTITSNSAAAGANATGTPAAKFKNTIVSNPLGGGANCNGNPTSLGFNITDTSGCGFTLASDKMNTNPMLDPAGPADNGGPTRTVALLPGSPAIDGGIGSAGETVDQRGSTRPFDFPDLANAAGGDGTDVGAFEAQDTTPPDTTITAGVAEGTVTRDPTQAFGFSSSEAGSTFECKLDGATFAACASPTLFSGLADGPHTFSVRAIDASLNADPTPASRSFTVDTKPPADTTPPQTKINSKLKPTHETKVGIRFGSSEKGSKFACKLDKGKFHSCRSPKIYKHLKPGKHTFRVRATDLAGNVDKTPAKRTFKILRKAG